MQFGSFKLKLCFKKIDWTPKMYYYVVFYNNREHLIFLTKHSNYNYQ